MEEKRHDEAVVGFVTGNKRFSRSSDISTGKEKHGYACLDVKKKEALSAKLLE